MDLEHPRKPAPEPLLAAWIKWTMDFWEDLAHMGPGLNGAGAETAASQAEGCLAALTLWQAFFSLLSEPGTVAAVFNGIKAPSEVILKMAQAGWSGYFYLHQQWLEGPTRRLLRQRLAVSKTWIKKFSRSAPNSMKKTSGNC